MKVTDNRNPTTTPLHETLPGSAHVMQVPDRSQPYMRVDPESRLGDSALISVVSLRTGRVYRRDPNTPVIPVDAEVVLT